MKSISKCCLPASADRLLRGLCAGRACHAERDDAAASNPATTTSSDSVGGPAAASADAASSGGAGDIVVTAQRRAQSVLSVPLSISAVKARRWLRPASRPDLPCASTPRLLQRNRQRLHPIFIRGIGNQIYVGADLGCDLHHRYAARLRHLVDDLMNVDRVEVLKGFQGGLYGRNATGGVVNVITRQPVNKFIAEARVSCGSKKTFEARRLHQPSLERQCRVQLHRGAQVA